MKILGATCERASRAPRPRDAADDVDIAETVLVF